FLDRAISNQPRSFEFGVTLLKSGDKPPSNVQVGSQYALQASIFVLKQRHDQIGNYGLILMKKAACRNLATKIRFSFQM
ncbi:MAG: hypothetical protein ACR2O0_06120, partial [Rhizobiaceae bacterium]